MSSLGGEGNSVTELLCQGRGQDFPLGQGAAGSAADPD